MKKIFAILIVTLLLCLPVYAEKFTIVYTGNSYASLYPCGVCPGTVGGGLTRRAAAIKKILEENKNVLIVDAGNFTAGGKYDNSSINYKLDKARTRYYYRAFEEIGYEAVCIGKAEFNFAIDFLKENINSRKFKFISTNIELEGVNPYYIKKWGDFAVAVLGISSKDASDNIKFTPYKESLRKAIDELRDKVSFFVLLSNASDDINEDIATNFKEIKVIISSAHSQTSRGKKKTGDVVILRSFYGARELTAIDIEVKDSEIVDYLIRRERLSLDLKEDEGIKALIPSCFSDKDCLAKEGLIVHCELQETIEPRCVYAEAKRLSAVLITDKDCRFCITQPTESILRESFWGIRFVVIDYKSDKAKQLIQNHKIDTLPAFILPSAIDKEKNFARVSELLIKSNDSYVSKKTLSGIFLFLDRKRVDSQIDVFLKFHDRNIVAILNNLRSFCEQRGVNLRVHLLNSSTFSGKEVIAESEEIRRILAIEKLYPDKFWSYLTRRIKNIDSSWWPDLMEELGIDYKTVKELAESQDLKNLVNEEIKLQRRLHMTGGIGLLVNNIRMFRILSVNPEHLEKILQL